MIILETHSVNSNSSDIIFLAGFKNWIGRVNVDDNNITVFFFHAVKT